MTTATLDISEARNQFSHLDERLREERVIYVTRHKRRAFAVVDPDYLATVLETIEILADPESARMLMESMADIAAGRLHDHDDVKREFL